MGRGRRSPRSPPFRSSCSFYFSFSLSLSVSSPFIFQRATIRTVWKFMYPRPVGVSITDIVSGRHKAKFRDFDVYSIPPTKFRPPSLSAPFLKGGRPRQLFHRGIHRPRFAIQSKMAAPRCEITPILYRLNVNAGNRRCSLFTGEKLSLGRERYKR